MSSPSPPLVPAVASRFSRKRLGIVIGVIAVVLFVAGVFVWQNSRPDEKRTLALKAAKEGSFAFAEEQLKSALADKPDDVEVIEALARGYLKSEKPHEAETYLTRWVELRPEDPEARRLRYEFYPKARKLSKAYPDGRRLLDLTPTDGRLRRALVGQAVSLGAYEDAESLCRECLRDEPGDRDLLSMLAECRRARGDLTEAGEILDRLLKDFPLYTPAILYLDSGQPEKAIPLFREVLRLDKTRQRSAGYQLAIALERSGKAEEAKQVTAGFRRLQDVEVFADAIKAQPDNLELRVRLGERLLAEGHTQDGLSYLHAVIAENPAYGPAHLALAKHYEQQGQAERAAEHRKLAGSTP